MVRRLLLPVLIVVLSFQISVAGDVCCTLSLDVTETNEQPGEPAQTPLFNWDVPYARGGPHWLNETFWILNQERLLPPLKDGPMVFVTGGCTLVR